MGPVGLLGIVIGGLLMIFVGVFVVVGIAVPMAKGIGWITRQIFNFVVGEIADSLRLVGATVTALLFVPLTLVSVFIGRWSAAAHYGKAIQGECAAFASALYRIAIGHPVALFQLTPLTEGVQRRLPDAVRAAPGRDKPPKRVGQFEGYTIVGSLKGGGSGGKLYVARADELKRATFERQGHKSVGQVVIKSFSLKDGSTLPQIIRESRALDAAKKLGLVLDHELTNERFFYVMRFVPGDSLAVVTQQWHAKSGERGLNDAHLSHALAHVMDVLRTLRVYHDGGLWHKDIKPDNIIVEGDRANVVDLGLVTPLRSNMTLTTHGTEYFRDPELVRLALKGVKVHQVDGAKFDIFAAGAVLYSIVENSFPAHGVLSQVKKRCPEAIKWIIRRAMADYDQRYVCVDDMFADLQVVARADDPFKIKPIDLPSMRGGVKVVLPETPEPEPMPAGFAGESQGAPASAKGPETVDRTRPRLKVRDWLRGGYEVEGHETVKVARRGAKRTRGLRVGPVGFYVHHVDDEGVETEQRRGSAKIPPERRRSAKEQLENARARAAAARERASVRRASRTGGTGSKAGDYRNGPNLGVGIAVVALGLVAGGAVLLSRGGRTSITHVEGETTRAELPGIPVLLEPRVLEGPSPDPASDVTVADTGADEPSVMGTSLTRTVGFAATTVGFAASQQIQGTRALIVYDARPPYTEDSERELRERFDRMISQRIVLVNSPFQSPDNDPEDLEVSELIADLYVKRGGRSLDSRGLGDQIGEWIGQTEGVDSVVWVAPNPLKPGDVLIELFTPKAAGGDLGAVLDILSSYTLEQLVQPKRN